MWIKTGLLWTVVLIGLPFGTSEDAQTTTPTTPAGSTTSTTDKPTTPTSKGVVTSPTAAATTAQPSTELPTTRPATSEAPTQDSKTPVPTTTIQSATEGKETTTAPANNPPTQKSDDQQAATTTTPSSPTSQTPTTVSVETSVSISTKLAPPPAATSESSTVRQTVERTSKPPEGQSTIPSEQMSTRQTGGSTPGSPGSTVLPSTEAHTSHISSTDTLNKDTTTQGLGGAFQQPALPTTDVPSKTFERVINWEDIQDPAKEAKIDVQICRDLLQKLRTAGNCQLAGVTAKGDTFTSVTLTVDPSAAQQIYNEIKEKDTTPPVPKTLIAILSSCGALVVILVGFALYCMYHHRSYRKNQQHLTEELQTVENGYHDNPTLEVMEVQPEMQEKKLTLNGEFNDSWIVPIDNLAKEEIPDEEDTHL